MKTKLTALTLSACLLGWSSASPEEKKGAQTAEIVPTAQQAGHAHSHAEANDAAKAARKERAAEHAKKAGERKAVKKKAVETKVSVAKDKDAEIRKAAEGKKMEDAKKALAAAEVKKAADAKKAQAIAAKKRTQEEKMQKMALARLQELYTQRKNAEANRIKAAEVLKASERKLAAISSEISQVNSDLKAKAEADRIKAEKARAQRTRESDEQEQAMILTMKNDIRQLKQTVEQLNQQVTGKKCACSPAPITATR
jgi:chromosome segregation ATPase